jgi:GT2 family glycosyltransferase/2-polyprenyl-3-methyl-5-hydroxy-6-metoxy-1,4-benzoquinol methylase
VDYFSLPRPDLLKKIPSGNISILDVGCGAGALGQQVKARQACFYCGIEIIPQIAERARDKLDKVLVGNIEELSLEKYKGKYDVIVCGDILEHLTNPWAVMQKLYKILKPEGLMIVSIPNILSLTVQSEVEKGLFRYLPAGVRDLRHLRFFTLFTACSMIEGVNLKIKSVEPMPAISMPEQYIITCKKVKRNFENIDVSVITLNWNTRVELAGLLSSLEENKSCNYEVIVVDQNSQDGSLEWLRELDDVRHIEGSQNCGFPCGNNLGIALAKSDNILLLNSDTLVPRGVLKRWVDVARKNKQYGVIGAVTNYASGPQGVKQINYTNYDEMSKYAALRFKSSGEKVIPFPRIVFFGALIKKVCLHKIGLLDESFGLGNCEDDDFTLRALKAKFGTGYAPGVYVHHYGHKAHINNDIDLAELIKKNTKLFHEKHGDKPYEI